MNINEQHITGYKKYYTILSFIFGILALIFTLFPIIPGMIAYMLGYGIYFYLFPIILCFIAILFGFLTRRNNLNTDYGNIGLFGGIFGLVIFVLFALLPLHIRPF